MICGNFNSRFMRSATLLKPLLYINGGFIVKKPIKTSNFCVALHFVNTHYH